MSAILANVILIIILVLAVGGACFYIYKHKKSGAQCLGCPSGGTCNCNCKTDKNKK